MKDEYFKYISDTHSLVWYFTSDSKLGKKAFDIFENMSENDIIYVPTLVLAELMYISKKGRVILSFSETIKRIDENIRYEILPLDIEILIEANKIQTELEMHDRLIIASAIINNAILITKDEQIVKSNIIETTW